MLIHDHEAGDVSHFPVAARLPQSVSNSRTVGGHRQPLAAGVPLPRARVCRQGGKEGSSGSGVAVAVAVA